MNPNEYVEIPNKDFQIICSRRDCQEVPDHKVSIDIDFPAYGGVSTANIELEYEVCSKHTSMKVEDVLDDKNWKAINEVFERNGLTGLIRKSARLVIKEA